jgi:hypothetical protein
MAGDRSERFASAVEFSSAVSGLRASFAPAALEQTQALPVEQAPPVRPPRPSPALTPGVFTAPPVDVRKPTSRLWVLGLAATGVLVSVFAAKFLSRPAPEALQPERTSHAVPALSPSPVEVASSAPRPSASMTAANPVPASAVSQKQRGVQPSALPASVPSANRSRANSYGLSEDNPFK